MTPVRLRNNLYHQLFRNSVTSVVTSMMGPLVNIVMTPWLLGMLGTDRYGIWSLINLVLIYGDIGNLGITAGIVNYVSERSVRKLDNLTAHVVTLAITINFILAGFVSSVVYIGRSPLIANILAMPTLYVPEAEQALSVGCLTLVVVFLSQSMGSILEGLQRVDLRLGAQAGQRLIWAASSFFALQVGYGVVGLMWSSFISELLIFLLLVMLVLRQWPSFCFRVHWADLPAVKPVLRYGVSFQWGPLATLFSVPLTKILVARFLSPAWVAYFDIAWRITQAPRSLGFAIQRGLMPAASALHAEKGRSAELRSVCGRYLIYTAVLVLPLFVLLGFGAETVVGTWVGSVERPLVLGVRTLSFVMGLSTLVGVPFAFARGMGYPGLASGAQIVSVVMLVCVGWSLFGLTSLGYSSILIGYVVGTVCSTAISFVGVNRLMGLRSVVRPLLATILRVGIVCSALVFALARLDSMLSLNRFQSVILLSVYLVVAYGLVWLWPAFPRNDRSVLLRYLSMWVGRLPVIRSFSSTKSTSSEWFK